MNALIAKINKCLSDDTNTLKNSTINNINIFLTYFTGNKFFVSAVKPKSVHATNNQLLNSTAIKKSKNFDLIFQHRKIKSDEYIVNYTYIDSHTFQQTTTMHT